MPAIYHSTTDGMEIAIVWSSDYYHGDESPRRHSMRIFTAAVLALLLAGGASCSSRPAVNATATKDQKRNEIVLKSLRIIPVNPVVAMGKSIDLMAIGVNSQGQEQSISPSWRIIEGAKAGSLASVSGSRVTFSGKAVGSSVVVAESSGLRGQIVVNVVKSTSRGK